MSYYYDIGDIMKRFMLVFIIFIILSLLVINDKDERIYSDIEKKELRAVFISYIELNNYVKGKSRKASKSNIDNMIKNIKKSKFNVIILQIRSHNDAIYRSDMFKVSDSIVLDNGSHYDILNYFQKKCLENNIDLFAWMNPYRIGKEENISRREWIDTTNIQRVGDVYYYNPASREVQNYLVDAVREVVKNYNIHALLFDDYFYPLEDIDEVEYYDYLRENAFVTKEDFHLMMVNNFIRNVYKTVKEEKSEVLFGISPEGNIDNNYSKNYADVRTWTSESGYIDFIMPQLYYGFFNSSRPYYDTLKEWNNMIKNDNILLFVALSFYKVGMIDNYAKEGYYEWINNNDIIKRQILVARSYDKYRGFSLFRYDNLFNEDNKNDNTSLELSNVINILE